MALKRSKFMNYYVETVFELLDKVDNNGVITLHFSNERLNWFDQMNKVNNLTRFKSNTETALFIMDNIFGEWGILNCPLKFKKTILKKIDLKTSKDNEKFTVQFDLFKYFNIKKNDPKTQIKEIKEFFTLSKKLMDQIKVKSKHDTYFGGTVRILNSRDKNGKTIYQILLQAWGGQDFPELNQKLVDKITGSPTLTELFTQTALTLNKLGPYAWATIRLKDLDQNAF